MAGSVAFGARPSNLSLGQTERNGSACQPELWTDTLPSEDVRISPPKKMPHRFRVIVSRRGRNRTWRWQIVRTPKALGVKLYEDNFYTEQAAKLAGQKALHAILEGVTKEERDP
jgi:hypothetical protein